MAKDTVSPARVTGMEGQPAGSGGLGLILKLWTEDHLTGQRAAAEIQTLGRRSIQISQAGLVVAQSHYHRRGCQWERVGRCTERATRQGPRRLPEAGAKGRQILPWSVWEEIACEALT